MQEPRVSARWRTVALLAVGIALGTAVTAAPVASHVGGTVSHLWKKHIRPKADDRYYTKAKANERYVNVGEEAIDGAAVIDRSLEREDVIRFEDSVTINVPNVPAQDCVLGLLAVPGMNSDTDEGWLFPSPNFFNAGALTITTYTTAVDANVLRYSVCNVDDAAVDPPSGSWHYLVVG